MEDLVGQGQFKTGTILLLPDKEQVFLLYFGEIYAADIILIASFVSYNQDKDKGGGLGGKKSNN